MPRLADRQAEWEFDRSAPGPYMLEPRDRGYVITDRQKKVCCMTKGGVEIFASVRDAMAVASRLCIPIGIPREHLPPENRL